MKSILKKLKELPFPGRCVGCEKRRILYHTESMTQYSPKEGWTHEEENPPQRYCKNCQEDYREYWDDKWKEYYGSLGV